MSYWRAKAHQVIVTAIAEAQALSLEGKALEQHVSKAYPWGERANHPYRIWCNEVALLVKGLKRPMSKSKAKVEAGVLPGQGSLFGDES